MQFDINMRKAQPFASESEIRYDSCEEGRNDERERVTKSYSREVSKFSQTLICFQGNAASEALLGTRGGTESKQQHYDLQQQNHEPCRYELQQFVECAQNQAEITLSKDFSEALKHCKRANSECCALFQSFSQVKTKRNSNSGEEKRGKLGSSWVVLFSTHPKPLSIFHSLASVAPIAISFHACSVSNRRAMSIDNLSVL